MPNYPSIYLELQKIWQKIDDLTTAEKDLTGEAGGILQGEYPNPSGLKSLDNEDFLTVSGSMDVSGSIRVDNISSKGSRANTQSRELTFESSGSINLNNYDSPDTNLKIKSNKGLDFVRTGSALPSAGVAYKYNINDVPVLNIGYDPSNNKKRGYIQISGSGTNKHIDVGSDGDVTNPYAYIFTTQPKLELNANDEKLYL